MEGGQNGGRGGQGNSLEVDGRKIVGTFITLKKNNKTPLKNAYCSKNATLKSIKRQRFKL